MTTAKKCIKIIHFIIIITILLLCSPVHEAEQHPDTLKVLFIANSLTFYHNLPEMISRLASSVKELQVLEVNMVAVGGASLGGHWNSGNALKQISRGSWDYVVLQDKGLNPVRNPENMYEYVRKFDTGIKKHGGKTLLYLTATNRNLPELQQSLNDAFFKIARELNAEIAPVGMAWEKAMTENPDLVLHLPDNVHPNLKGAYLTACVFYAVLYKRNPGGLPNQITVNGSVNVLVSPPEAEFLQQIAWETVKNLQNGEKHENE